MTMGILQVDTGGEPMGNTAKIAIALPKSLLEDVDRLAATRKVSRSRVIRDAVQEALRLQREEEVRARIDAALDDQTAEEMRQEAEGLLGASILTDEAEEW
jgi:metal-responsive CopG/Arc/MetJ family transcriptional regulator